MIPYLIALIPFLFIFGNPILDFLSGSSSCQVPKIHRIPKPKLNTDLLALKDDDKTYQCERDGYKIHVYSREPLVIYFEGFLSEEERDHLLKISEPLYEPSTITHNGGKEVNRDTSVRDSEVAVVPRDDVVKCIEDRARSVQGWREEVWIERLRVQRYGVGGHYSHHYDWSSAMGGWGRVSSFMVWVDDAKGELEGGGTEFSKLPGKNGKWCKFLDCESQGNGTVFKVAPGNAVYWENFRSDGTGRGYEETWHAGLPVKKGKKIGLNIWSWGRMD
ncbi:hypothetical protein QBC38DRAFT_528639 [Podospora fimiseda]|uniref:Prolyl 4-hydroxylase alpha subunit domain-containing protein n=1 Tax=Podospora fimiseda TaxID=252190 RepID=A0AAN7BXQ5_9PEZI|nr:hypothetical protein QBC38DRAFT_528639 [Podospora fimiseda]